MRAWLEVDLNQVRRNAEIVREHIGGIGLIAVVKSDAYGLGLVPVAAALDQVAVDMFAVIDVNEATRIREVSNRPVLILGYLDSNEVIEAIEQDFVLSLYDRELIPFYERVAARLGRTVKIHVKVDTGLNRLGLTVDEAADFLMASRLFPHLSVAGIFSHLQSADDPEANRSQLAELQRLLVKIQGRAEVVPIHFVSSRALSFNEGYFDAVRVGMALYGSEAPLPGLEPVLSCKSKVMQVRRISLGDAVGYGGDFVAKRDSSIAVVAIGYGEGYSHSQLGELIIQGRRLPVVGRVSMNMTTVDVTGCPVKRGDEVVVIGTQRGADGSEASITVGELAKQKNVRHHNVMTRLGNALPKFYTPAHWSGGQKKQHFSPE